ncbi:hypothetical protein F2Q68_00041435 [Brassica cretica]|uniref:Uncharacterized protein n=1 Tax=Brassica cretica TaxID=69181 RepID=A0A8S9MKC2_BRACR|nr:hypothetical protein F2Q68_00041435 [Brassica cretica]
MMSSEIHLPQLGHVQVQVHCFPRSMRPHVEESRILLLEAQSLLSHRAQAELKRLWLLEIEEVVAAGDDEAGSSSFCGVSHPPEKPSIAEEPATSLSPFSTARATSLQSQRQGVPKSFCRHSWKFVQLRT